MARPRRWKRRVRPPECWSVEVESEAPEWSRWAAALLAMLRRTRAALTTREVMLWALDRRLERDPRELLAWCEAAGHLFYLEGRWHLLR